MRGFHGISRALLSARSRTNMQWSSIPRMARAYQSKPLTSILQRPSSAMRMYSTKPNSEKKKGGFFQATKVVLGWCGVIVAVPVGYFVAFMIYDSTTYQGGPLVTDVAIPIDSLHLKRGGPKNLPIADSFIDDVELGHDNDKPKLVILGSGWGAVALLNNLDTEKYNVTLISPTNHFLFTPLLPSASVGTLSLDTLVEPMRHVCQKRNVRLLQAAGHDVDFDGRLLEVRSDDGNYHETDFYVPYDKLVIATGASTNTHGVKGLENCYFFKTAEDCEKLRFAICRNLEAATLPTANEAERRRLLSFVICGGGPTGVELASEIYDLLKEDVSEMYPHLLVNLASVHIIQSRSAILNTYDETISKYAMKRFMHDGIDLQTNARVQEVGAEQVYFTKVDEHGNKQIFSIPSGLTLWTTGVGLSRFVKCVMERLGEHQHNRRALETDSQLRVIGTKKGEVYAIGDCATVRQSLARELEEVIKYKLESEQVDINGEYKLSTIEECLLQVVRNEPSARLYLLKLRDKLHKWYQPNDLIPLSRVIGDLQKVNSKLTSLPATAQRANQQGIYMGKKLNRLALASPDKLQSTNDLEDTWCRPFNYHHLGSLAYVSNAAVFDTGESIGFNLFGGVMAMYLWRSVYWSQTVTYRARVHMFFDWLYRGLFGRQIYSYDRVAKHNDR